MATRKVKHHPGIFVDVDSGEYGFVIDVPGADGRRRQKRRRGYRTVRAAEEARDEVRGGVRRGQIVVPTKLTLANFITVTWLPIIAQRVRPTTLDGYRRTVDNHILPRLGDNMLQRLSRATVATWVTGLSVAGLAPKTVRNTVGILTKVLDDAQELGLVTTNVAQRLKHVPKAPSPKPKAWTMAQTQCFIDHVRGDRWFVMWRFLAVSGVRRGEALGLRWDDLDLDAATVTIRRQRTIAGGSVVEGPPKTSSGFRTIALDVGMVAALRSWRVQQAEERLAMGAGWRGTGEVFCWPDGSLPWPQRVTEWFRGHCDELGLERIGVHGLRHSAATWMIARGESPKLVQARLGHSHVATTLALYAHVQPGHDQAAADALGAALDGDR